MKKGKRGAGDVLRNASAAVCAAVLVMSGSGLLKTLSAYRAGADSYELLRESVAVSAAGAETGRAPNCEDPAAEPAAPDTPGGPEAPEPIDFNALKAINGDAAAWLRCPGTGIDYPVVQGENNSHYLRRLITGEYNAAGTLFIDCRNRPFTDRNTVIYGHNMRDKSMFWTLLQYKKQAFYDEHPVMRISTPEREYAVQIFAGFTAGTDTDAWKLEFGDDGEFAAWLLRERGRSVFLSGVQVSAADKVVTLSTCCYDFPGARFVVVGRLTENFS